MTRKTERQLFVGLCLVVAAILLALALQSCASRASNFDPYSRNHLTENQRQWTAPDIERRLSDAVAQTPKENYYD